jgi:glycosyltransferase involved in cell wall biosynthesis
VLPTHARDIDLASHSSVYGVGGGVTVTEQLATTFEQRGYRCLVLGVGENIVPVTDHGASAGRLNLRVSTPKHLWRLRNWLMPGALARSLSELPPPRVAFVGVNPLWILAAKRAWPDIPTVFLFVALLSNCQPFTWPRRRPTFWQRMDHAAIRRAEHLALSVADRIIVPTRQARDELENFHPASGGRIDVCTYGSEPRTVSAIARANKRTELGLSDEDVVVLAVGVCNVNKGFDLAIREMKSVDARGHLVVIGEGPERNSLARLAEEQGVANRVRLVGRQPELDPWYAAADCVLSTSRYDTFPYAILDGMSSGRPVVVPCHAPPNVYAGLAEFVADHGGGVLYDRQRNGALAACVNELIRHPQSRAALGDQGREVALRHLHWDTCANLVIGDVAKQTVGAPTPPANTLPESQTALVASAAARPEEV